jgi:TonB family protein
MSGMFELKPLVPKTERALIVDSPPRAAYDPKQRRLMVVALGLLLVALGFVLYRDRDFWFPDGQEAEVEQPTESVPAASTAQPAGIEEKTSATAAKSKHRSIPNRPDADDSTSDAATPPITATRTVLPPLEVEVVAGDSHRTVRPGSNSVKVDLQPSAPPQAAPEAAVAATEIPADVTTNAAERVQMSAGTADVLTRPVKPGYPMLARQMKVQGSVILKALIGKDGTIQTLQVVSGPPILASAAQAAVRQWHFKPHYSGSEAVETQAKITVNFTISTN